MSACSEFTVTPDALPRNPYDLGALYCASCFYPYERHSDEATQKVEQYITELKEKPLPMSKFPPGYVPAPYLWAALLACAVIMFSWGRLYLCECGQQGIAGQIVGGSRR